MGAQTMSFIPGTAKSRVANFGSRSSSLFSKALLVTLLGLTVCPSGGAQDGSSAKSKNPIAIAGGKPIYEDQLPASVGAQLQRLRKQEFELKWKPLDDLLSQRLLELEAKKRGITVEKLLELEVERKMAAPTHDEVEGYYLAKKSQISRPLEDVNTALQEELKQAKVQEAREAYLKQLQQASGVLVLLRPPKIEVNYDPERLRGSRGTPVTIVEPGCTAKLLCLPIAGRFESHRLDLASKADPIN